MKYLSILSFAGLLFLASCGDGGQAAEDDGADKPVDSVTTSGGGPSAEPPPPTDPVERIQQKSDGRLALENAITVLLMKSADQKGSLSSEAPVSEVFTDGESRQMFREAVEDKYGYLLPENYYSYSIADLAGYVEQCGVAEPELKQILGRLTSKRAESIKLTDDVNGLFERLKRGPDQAWKELVNDLHSKYGVDVSPHKSGDATVRSMLRTIVLTSNQPIKGE